MAAYMLVREGMTKGFNQADVDGDGFISEEELGTLLSSIGETMSEEEVASQFKEANVLNKDKITYEQWCKVRCAVDTSAVWLVAETRGSLHLSATGLPRLVQGVAAGLVRRRRRLQVPVGQVNAGRRFRRGTHTHTRFGPLARILSERERADMHGHETISRSDSFIICRVDCSMCVRRCCFV